MGETIIQATIRELREECGLITEEADLKNSAYLVFLFPEKPSWSRAVNVFTTKKWHGSLTISDEMVPQWFKYENIPYDLMWEDDREWLSLVTEAIRFHTGYFITGCFIFDADIKLNKSVVYMGKSTIYSG